MNTPPWAQGVNFQMPPGGQLSRAVDKSIVGGEVYDSKASAKNGICLRSEERRDAPVVDLTYRTREWPVEQTVPGDLT